MARRARCWVDTGDEAALDRAVTGGQVTPGDADIVRRFRGAMHAAYDAEQRGESPYEAARAELDRQPDTSTAPPSWRGWRRVPCGDTSPHPPHAVPIRAPGGPEAWCPGAAPLPGDGPRGDTPVTEPGGASCS